MATPGEMSKPHLTVQRLIAYLRRVFTCGRSKTRPMGGQSGGQLDHQAGDHRADHANAEDDSCHPDPELGTTTAAPAVHPFLTGNRLTGVRPMIMTDARLETFQSRGGVSPYYAYGPWGINTKKRPPFSKGRALVNLDETVSRRTAGLLRVMHLGRSGGGLDFLELGKRAESRGFRLASAAARGGDERECGGGEGGDETDHGTGGARFFRGIRTGFQVNAGPF